MSQRPVDKTSLPDLQELNEKYRSGLIGLLGITYTHISADRVEATMPVNENTCQPFGVLHGGASLALAETIAGVGTLGIIGRDQHAVGQQVSGNHVSVAYLGDTVRAVASLLHKGRSSHVWHVDIFSQTSGKLVSSAQVLYAILQK